MNREIRSAYAKNSKEWRRWLSKNHKKQNKVNLIKYKKHTGKPSLSSKEAMEDAICFGWIDTTVNRLDEDRYMQRFSKRNKKSRWSKNTLGYAKKMIKQGKMTEAGLEAYKIGLKNKPLDHKLPKNPNPPEDLIKEINKTKKATNNFNNMAPSYKKSYIRWIEYAKKLETRKRRIKTTVERIKSGKKFGE